MKEINLTQGYVAIVDDEDFDEIAKFKWQVKVVGTLSGISRVYARARTKDYLGHIKNKYLHRMILGVEHGFYIDHIDGNGLNNCRSNLRICTNSENCNNRHTTWGKSKFKGVTFVQSSGKWRAQIYPKGCKIDLGYFNKEIDAARAYNSAAITQYGCFACLNVIWDDK